MKRYRIRDHRGLALHVYANVAHYLPYIPPRCDGHPDDAIPAEGPELELEFTDVNGRYTHNEIMRFISEDDYERIYYDVIEELEDEHV